MTSSANNILLSGAAADTLPDDYYTYVEGVGSIPRDIYKLVTSNPFGDLPRYSPHIVIQHLLVFISFFMLAGTGIPLNYPDTIWAPHMIAVFGGADTARYIHRIGAAIMVFASAYHLLFIVGSATGKILRKEFDIRRTQMPMPKDLFDLIHDIKYFLGFAPLRPKMEKFMYKQKLHYLAILWGTFVLISAGTTLLFPEHVAMLWPSNPAFVQAVARLMHADEAIMALIVIALWHFANVHLAPGRFPLQWTFLTGKITREHQIEEHFLEYLRNLKEIPAEREYMRSLLQELNLSDAGREQA